MARLCEITKEKVDRGQGIDGTVGTVAKKPSLLKRKIVLKELDTSVRLWLSERGVKILQEQGGLGSFLAKSEEKSLSPKLKKLRAELPEVKKRLAAETQARAQAQAQANVAVATTKE